MLTQSGAWTDASLVNGFDGAQAEIEGAGMKLVVVILSEKFLRLRELKRQRLLLSTKSQDGCEEERVVFLRLLSAGPCANLPPCSTCCTRSRSMLLSLQTTPL